MIKLTPEHVGGRVLLSDGLTALIASYENGKFFICWANSATYFEQDDKGLFTEDTVVGGKAYLHAELLLDAPNPLDVEVPDWCERIVGWHDGEGPTEIVPASRHRHWSKYPPDLCDLIKWSPAPGQLPPKNNEEIK